MATTAAGREGGVYAALFTARTGVYATRFDKTLHRQGRLARP
ncbi:MAG TPA: hypothetical protein VFQ68_10055 [Streptosporangiaceae bacterium]|nr:hypothetical protein [Streptosporangiaceae bacterium]